MTWSAIGGLFVIAILLLANLIRVSRKNGRPVEIPEAVRKYLNLPENPPVMFTCVPGLPAEWVAATLIIFGVVAAMLIARDQVFSLGFWLLLGYLGYEFGYARIKRAHFGVGFTLDARNKRIYLEGHHPLVPVLETITIVDQELDTKPLEAAVTTHDGLDVGFKGSLQPRPSYWVTDRQGRNRYIEIDIRTIMSGINDKVREQLSELAGAVQGFFLYWARNIVGLIVETLLRLGEIPHRAGTWDSRIDSDDDTSDFKYDIDIPIPDDLSTRLKEELGLENIKSLKDLVGRDLDVPPEIRIHFYRKNQGKIRRALEEEDRKKVYAYSSIECRYGIEVITFALATIEFTLATRAAQEAKTQAELFRQAVKEFEDAKAQDPVASALAYFGKATQRNIAFQGLEKGGAIPLVMTQGGN